MGSRLLVVLVPWLLMTTLPITTPSAACASTRVDLLLGLRVPSSTDGTDAHDVHPAIGIEGSLEPAGWPVGLTAYVAGSADWYEGVTTEPPFADWASTDNRVTAGEIGVGVERSWRVGRTLLSLSGGLMASSTADHAKSGDWSRTRTTRANGEWVSVAISRAVRHRFGVGVRGRYTWAEYVPAEWKWVEAGGLQLGVSLGIR